MKKFLIFGVTLAVLSATLQSISGQTQSATVQVSKLVGTRVKSSDGDEIGVIKDVVIDRNSGCMAYTVLSTEGRGGTGGGGKLVAVPWTVYSPSSDVSVLTTTVDRERIYSAPVFDYARVDEFSRPDYISNVYSYYGVTQGAGAGVDVSRSSTTSGTSSAAASERDTAGSQSNSPATTKSPVESESPAGKGSPRPHATASPHERGEATATPSRRRDHGTRGTPEETESPRGGADLQNEPSRSNRESPSEAESPRERNTEGTPARPHRKPERAEGNTPPPDDGSGEHR